MSSQTSGSSQETKGAVELSVAMAMSGTIGVFVVQSGAPTADVVLSSVGADDLCDVR